MTSLKLIEKSNTEQRNFIPDICILRRKLMRTLDARAKVLDLMVFSILIEKKME
jgi:hypothetical protein